MIKYKIIFTKEFVEATTIQPDEIYIMNTMFPMIMMNGALEDNQSIMSLLRDYFLNESGQTQEKISTNDALMEKIIQMRAMGLSEAFITKVLSGEIKCSEMQKEEVGILLD